MTQPGVSDLDTHLAQVRDGKRRFENAFQGVSRMILDGGVDKVVVNGKTTYDFSIFRTGAKHIIGMYEELNSFVSYVKDAAQGGSSMEMAFVLVGEPGNGKTFLVDFLCARYRSFLAREGNRKYTFRFLNMDRIEGYGRIRVIESQTYEDPMILAMNLFDDPDQNKEYLAGKYRFTDEQIRSFYHDYRPLGPAADTSGTTCGPGRTATSNGSWNPWRSCPCPSPRAWAR